MVCLAVLGTILTAGLWPFGAPRNDVTWLSGGLRFGRHGSAVSRSFLVADSDANGSSTLEIWLRPDLHRHSGVIVSFDSLRTPAIPFALRQNKDAVVVQQANLDRDGNYRMAWLAVPHVMRAEQVLVTVTEIPHRTDVYVNGVRARSFPIQGTLSPLEGKLLLSGLPNAADSWTGTIQGLAIYKQALSPEQVAADYQSWTMSRHPASTIASFARAIYDFREPSGEIVHDRADSRNDLTIPARYFVLHPVFLRSSWRSYRNNWPYWQDMLVNIIGFIPLGFFFAAYFCLTRRWKALLLTAFLGFATSFTIEALQYFLPTRDSGTTDLMTNELGTVIGAALYSWSVAQRFIAQIVGCDDLGESSQSDGCETMVEGKKL